MDEPMQFCYSLMYYAQNRACFYCSKLMENGSHTPERRHGYTRDHVLPRSLGYGTIGNIVLCCDKCNRKKGKELPNHNEIERCVQLWNRIKGGPIPELLEFMDTQRLLNTIEKWCGKRVVFPVPI